MSYNYSNIPETLKNLRQWVARVDKMPINPNSLYGAKSTDKSHWGTFEQAISAIGKIAKAPTVKGKPCNGIGFMLSAPYCGIDIDHCRNPQTGEITAEAQDIIEAMNSYTEISPSGTGVHILYMDNEKKYEEWQRKKNTEIGNVKNLEGCEKQSLEMYQCERYFTVTGNILDKYNTVEERSVNAELVYKAYMCDTDKEEPKQKAVNLNPQPAVGSLSDNDIIEKAMNAKNGKLFSALFYDGDTSAYNKDESSADLALCNILAFWCGGNAETIDRLFRQSGLMREKWDRKTGSTTYGEMTIQKAIKNCSAAYDENFAKTKAMNAFKNSIRFTEPTSTEIRGLDDICKNSDEPSETEPTLPEFDYEMVKKYSADDIGTAKFFADIVKGYICYTTDQMRFYLYDGTRWRQDSRRATRTGNVLADFVKAVQAVIPKKPDGKPTEWGDKEAEEERINGSYRQQYKNLCNANARDRVLKDIIKRLDKSSNIFDRQPYLFNVKNGTINLETGVLQSHRPDDYISKLANVVYNPNAKEERFEQFIEEITESNIERAAVLQRCLGYAMQGYANEECFFVALGKTTRNGKGTLFDTVLNLFGDYGTQIDFNTIARTGSKDGSRATPDVARLQGVRLVLCNEPEKGSCFNEALIKQLTGNDDIVARPLYCDPVVFKPVFKIFITANDMPTVADDSIFQSNRMKIIPFNRHFNENEQDKNLKEKLRSENAKSSILNWLLSGYRKYKQAGDLGITDEMKELADKYRQENDYIKMYIDERLNVFDASDIHAPKTTLKAVISDYKLWCDQMGIQKPLGLHMFKRELEKHNVPPQKAHNQWYIKGTKKTNYPNVG